MSNFIGDASGGLTHYWPGPLCDRLAENAEFGSERSGKEMPFSIKWLKAQDREVRAAILGFELYNMYKPEFQTWAYKIAGQNARFIATLTEESPAESGETTQDKWLVRYFAWGELMVQHLQELAWLRHALGAGATPADLIEWGVDKFTVLQLTWWERRPGETRLAQHIRAIRNGWGLRYLEAAVREVYGNLLRSIDRGEAPKEFLETFAEDIAEVREVLDFFDEKTPTLTTERQAEWAMAFLDGGITKIAPDAWGQYAHFLPASFKRGELRKPFEPIARYLEKIGVQPIGWTEFDASWFGREK